MSEPSPSEVLRAAARHIRHLADQATPGPWRDEAMGSEGSVVLAGGNTVRTARRPARCSEFADARWIAAFSPAISGPLAVWLEVAANDVQGQEHVSPTWPALAFARLVLSSVPNPPGEAM